MTALSIAVEKGNIEIVQLLLNQPKIDVNSKASISTNQICSYVI